MVAQINPRNLRTSERVPAKPRTRSQLWPKGSGRAPTRVMEVRRRHPGEQTRVTSESRPRQLPEPRGVNPVLLHLEVQGLVVGSEEPRRLALVPPRDLEDPADRLLLGVSCGRLGDLLQRGVEGPRIFAGRDRRRWVQGQDREVLRLNDVRSEKDGAANDVPELPHVPGPVVAKKDLSRRF